jgi:hypothetical protein
VFVFFQWCFTLFGIFEAVDSGHTVRPWHGLACILVPIILNCVHLLFVMYHYNHG